MLGKVLLSQRMMDLKGSKVMKEILLKSGEESQRLLKISQGMKESRQTLGTNGALGL